MSLCPSLSLYGLYLINSVTLSLSLSLSDWLAAWPNELSLSLIGWPNEGINAFSFIYILLFPIFFVFLNFLSF